MNFQFGLTPNKTTPGFTMPTGTPVVQGTAPSAVAVPTFGSAGALGALGGGDAKATGGLTFNPQAATATGAQKPLGFSFGASPAIPASTIPTGTATPSGFTMPLGASVGTATTTTAASASVAPLTLFSSATPSAAAPKLGTTTTSTTTTVSISQPQPGQSTAATSLVTSTLVTPSAASTGLATGTMNYIQLEEIINKWTFELEEQEKLFINQATQINAWDRLLSDNSAKIVELNGSVENVKVLQQQLDFELDFILAQQRELEECLVPLEKQLAATPQTVDPQRENMYHMAESMDTQLKQMSEDLKEIIDHLNESGKVQDSNDPIIQIGKILNAHMNSLQWIDEHVLQLQNRIDEVSKLHDLHRRENERSFRSTYE